MNGFVQESVVPFVKNNVDLFDFSNKRFLITGSTGLIGSILVRCLLAFNQNIKIVAPVRNIEKAQHLFGNDYNKIGFIEGELVDLIDHCEEKLDYIIHCASPTNGQYMTGHPVETFELAVESTRALLNYAVRHQIEGMVYISSLEYYGQNLTDDVIDENFVGYVDPNSARSSYPLGKRAAEYLCKSYAKEYSVPVKVARLTQTFGPGVAATDNRVFAQFARSVIEGKDIVLHTKGQSSKPYVHTLDCASAILCILTDGVAGEAYNVANPDTYISIKEMAEFVRKRFNPDIRVVVEENESMGYAPETRLNLSAEKLMSLGWRPKYNLKQMYDSLIRYLKNL